MENREPFSEPEESGQPHNATGDSPSYDPHPQGQHGAPQNTGLGGPDGHDYGTGQQNTGEAGQQNAGPFSSAGHHEPESWSDPYRQPSSPTMPSGEKGRSITALTFASWILIVFLTLFLFATTVYEQFNPSASVGDASAGDLMQINLQAKMMVGQNAIAPPAVLPPELDTGPPEARWCFSILTGEFDDTETALKHLDETDDLIREQDYELTEDQLRLRSLIGEIIEIHDAGDYDTEYLADGDQQFVKDRLGFCGRLLLHPEGSGDSQERNQLVGEAQRALIIMMLVVLGGGAALVAGIIVSIVFLVKVSSGTLYRFFEAPRSNGGIYAETFAIWLVMFIGGQLTAAIALSNVLSEIGMMFVMAGVFFASLLVLAWPVIRGIPFSQVRKDIGWELKNPFVEAVLGAISYVSMLPAMFVALILAVIIMGFVSAASGGSENDLTNAGAQGHPIQEQIAQGNPLLFLGVFLTACVAAPIVEETMFRGVLYRHMRESSWRWGSAMTVMVSALISSLIFAAIHPQGLFGIPILTTLAVGFCFVREWRGSLIGPMVMHAINNSIVTCLLFSIM